MRTKIIIAVLTLSMSLGVQNFVLAQERVKSQSEVTKEEKKAAKKAAKEAMKAEREKMEMQAFHNAVKALEDNQWVLEANRVFDKYGNSVVVNDNTNFVAMEGEKAYVQLAFTGMEGGPNTIGGITVKGTQTKKDMKRDKKGNVIYKVTVMGAILNADINIRMSKGGNYADAEVNSMTTGDRIKFSGILVPRDESSYYRSGFDF